MKGFCNKALRSFILEKATILLFISLILIRIEHSYIQLRRQYLNNSYSFENLHFSMIATVILNKTINVICLTLNTSILLV